MPLTGKKILLGVSGSIAAYKAADICSQLGKLGADVTVILTENAQQFVGVPTFRALTRNPVLTGVFDEPNAKRIAHIDLAQSANLVLIAPASANLTAKMTHGIADDMLTTCLLALPTTTPLLVAPAMNTVMWEHPATVANLQTLKSRGVEILVPGYGLLACLDVGAGKLASVEEIVGAVRTRLISKQDFVGKRVLVTAGATREPLDPVRFLSNRSSGKMGFALAEAAQSRGAKVTLVSGFTTVEAPKNVELIRVGSAEEMYRACQDIFSGTDIFISAAAVADYAPETIASEKIKKPTLSADSIEEEVVKLRLKLTPHIVALLSAQKQSGQIVVGFAAETQDAVANARKKPYFQNLDLVVVNDVTQPGAGFDVDTNRVTFVTKLHEETLPLMSKREVAERILNRILTLGEG